jgi:hypothetical protein
VYVFILDVVLKRYVEFYKLDATIRAALTEANDGSVDKLPTLPTRQLKVHCFLSIGL